MISLALFVDKLDAVAPTVSAKRPGIMFRPPEFPAVLIEQASVMPLTAEGPVIFSRGKSCLLPYSDAASTVSVEIYLIDILDEPSKSRGVLLGAGSHTMRLDVTPAMRQIRINLCDVVGNPIAVVHARCRLQQLGSTLLPHLLHEARLAPPHQPPPHAPISSELPSGLEGLEVAPTPTAAAGTIHDSAAVAPPAGPPAPPPAGPPAPPPLTQPPLPQTTAADDPIDATVARARARHQPLHQPPSVSPSHAVHVAPAAPPSFPTPPPAQQLPDAPHREASQPPALFFHHLDGELESLPAPPPQPPPPVAERLPVAADVSSTAASADKSALAARAARAAAAIVSKLGAPAPTAEVLSAPPPAPPLDPPPPPLPAPPPPPPASTPRESCASLSALAALASAAGAGGAGGSVRASGSLRASGGGGSRLAACRSSEGTSVLEALADEIEYVRTSEYATEVIRSGLLTRLEDGEPGREGSWPVRNVRRGVGGAGRGTSGRLAAGGAAAHGRGGARGGGALGARASRAARMPSMILSPASILGMHHAEKTRDQGDLCSRRYAPPHGNSVDSLALAATSTRSSVACDGAVGGAGGAPPPLRVSASLDLVQSPAARWTTPSRHAGDVSSSDGSIPPSVRTSAAPATPPPPGAPPLEGREEIETRRAILGHLQMAFARLDREGKGVAPTDALARALHTLLASQTATQRASKGWAGGMRQLVAILDANIEEARLGGVEASVDHLSTAWDELLALAAEVNTTISAP